MEFGLSGQTAVVTASSQGLGKASAASLAREGANVVICGRTPETLETASEDVREYAAAGAEPGDVLAVEADITDPDDIDALVAATVERFGALDHVVTSAGGPPSVRFADTTEREWYEAYDLLVMSVVRLLWRARDHLVASDAGTVTAITSRTVVEPAPGLVLSNAVRQAVQGLIKTVSREWAPDVRANTVLPAIIETQRIENIIEQELERGVFDSYEAAAAARRDTIPLERMGRPQELGDVVAFLASERASFVNGAAVPVDGGQLQS